MSCKLAVFWNLLLCLLLVAVLPATAAPPPFDLYHQIYRAVEHDGAGRYLVGGHFGDEAVTCRAANRAFVARYDNDGTELWRQVVDGAAAPVCEDLDHCNLTAGLTSLDPLFIVSSSVTAVTPELHTGDVLVAVDLVLSWLGTPGGAIHVDSGRLLLRLDGDGQLLADEYLGPKPGGPPSRATPGAVCPGPKTDPSVQRPGDSPLIALNGNTGGFERARATTEEDGGQIPAGEAISVEVLQGLKVGGNAGDVRASDNRYLELQSGVSPLRVDFKTRLRLSRGVLCLELAVPATTVLEAHLALDGGVLVPFGIATLYPGGDNVVAFPMELLTDDFAGLSTHLNLGSPAILLIELFGRGFGEDAGEAPRTSIDQIIITIKPGF